VGVAHPVHHRAICDMESLIQRSSHPLDLSSLMISGAGGHHRSRLNRAFDDEGGDERRTGPILQSSSIHQASRGRRLS